MTIPTMYAAIACIMVGCAAARGEQPPAQTPSTNTTPTTVAGEGTLTRDSSVDQILDTLHLRGADLRTLTAGVKLTETDVALGNSWSRGGRFWLENRPDGSTRARVLFTRKDQDGRATAEKIEYLLDRGKLIDRNYDRKNEVTRVILRPGEKLNLLQLGKGPFPLPIGQSREDVLASFDVTRLDAADDDPPQTTHVQLVPKPSTSLAGKFKTIDVWVNLSDGLPARIATLDLNQTNTRTTDLSELSINGPVNDSDFAVEPVDASWKRIEEPYQGN